MSLPVPSTPGELPAPKPALSELAWLFLRLGATAFGGPAAHVAMMEDEVVQRRRWLTRKQFLDLFAATNLIPGPNSTEMAIHVGLLAGWRGLIVAGVCFILPAALLVTLIAWAYVEYQALPELAGVLYGVKPVIIAVVLQAFFKLGKDAIRTLPLAAVAVGAILLHVFLAADELLLLLAAGLAMASWHGMQERDTSKGALSCVLFATVGGHSASVVPAVFGMAPLFLFFLKVGSILYGSGYVLLAFLRSDLVERWGWLTEAELLDAVAVGQVTPGPVFTTATFIGYVLGEKHEAAGPLGALLATVGIFLPAFVFVALSGPLVPRVRKSKVAGAFLDGVVAASLALMAIVTFELGRAALVDWLTISLAAVSAFLLLVYRVNSTWLVLCGALAGWIWTHFS